MFYLIHMFRDPRVLLADEPTGNLDGPATGRQGGAGKRIVMLAAVVVVLGLVLAGCGSSGGNNAPGGGIPSRPGGQPPQLGGQTFAKLQSCLRKHGVTMPTPGSQQGQPGQGQPPTFDAKTKAAMQACSRYFPSQPRGGFGG